MAQTKIWTGDPVWIAGVLRAEGVKLVEYPGRQNSGHGDFKDIRGVMVHHTGSDNATAASLAKTVAPTWQARSRSCTSPVTAR